MPPMGAEMRGVSGLIDALDDIEDRWTARATYQVGTNVEYSVEVEYGTSDMAAQPYLRPAIEQVRRELPALAAEADSIEELAEKAALRAEEIAKSICPVDTGNLRSSISVQRVQ